MKINVPNVEHFKKREIEEVVEAMTVRKKKQRELYKATARN